MNMKEQVKNGRFPLLKKPALLTEMNCQVEGHRIWMFRDDPEDFAFGGNKVRFFEYLIPEILEAQPEILISSGSRFSNHIRVTAEVAALLGISCILLITEEPEELTGASPGGNVEISGKLGAKIEYIGHFAALLKIGEYVKRLEEQGKKVFLVPNGGHIPGAVRAYAAVAEYALNTLESYGVKPGCIYLPCASGTTHAGLLCGGARVQNMPRVCSVAVANTVKGGVKGVGGLIRKAGMYLPEQFVPDEIIVTDCGKNWYGCPDEELRSLREEVHRTDGVWLDPTYNINAFYGMREILARTPGKEPVLYINTGGNTILD